MTGPASEATAVLARFAVGLDASDVPNEVAAQVKLLLLDALGSALVGWTSRESHLVAGIGRELFGEGESIVIGSSSLSPGAAALVNGYLITARSFCDVHQPTLCHVTPVTVPPILAAAQLGPTDGSTLLAGLAAAMEATVRIGQALVYPTFRGRGWHTPGVAGPVGGALGAARVLGTDPAGAERAAGIGGSQSAGTFASFGTPTIKLHQARAAWAALFSAVSAHRGFEGPAAILTADDGGLLNTYSDGGDPGAVVDGLGDRWELGGITTRLWPTAASLQSVVSMILIDRPDLPAPSDIASVVVSLPPAGYTMNAATGWDTPFMAVLSARFVTATVLEERRCGLDQFTPERLIDPGSLVERIEIDGDDTLPDGGAAIRMVTRGGDTIQLRRPHPKGHPTDPASWDEVAAKFAQAADGVLDADRAEEVVAMVDHLETLPDAAALIRLLAPSRGGGAP